MPSRSSGRRAQAAASLATLLLVALVLYWPALTSWFQKDDFVWLGLRLLVHGWRDLRWALFAPLAQGTIRTLSERAFFLLFTTIFGLHPLPFHAWSFLIFGATLPFLVSVCAKLTGSRAAGYWAALLWTVSGGVAIALSWVSISYELLCALFFVAGLWLLMRYVETGQARYYAAQCLIFLLGFGVLELNVVYPALASVYALCCARRILPKILPWFAVSAAYTAAHLAVAHLPSSGPYRMHWDASVFSTLWTYWKLAMGPSQLIVVNIHPSFWRSSLTALLTLGLIGFLLFRLWQRRWLAAFFPAWFLIVLAPLLPLRDKIDTSYLTIPAIGLAMWGGWALISGWRSGWPGRAAAAALLLIYLAVAIPVARARAVSFHDRSERIRRFILGVADFGRRQPGKLILLKDVDAELFWSAVYHGPFRLFDVPDVYLLAEDRPKIPPDPQLEDPHAFFADPAVERDALAQHRAIVLDVGSGNIRDITPAYRAPEMQSGFPLAAKVDVGNDLLAGQLGPTWYPNEGGFRWMPKHATVSLRGPQGPAEKLYITGACPAPALRAGPLRIEVTIDGQNLAAVAIRRPEPQFSFVFALPARLIGRPSVEIGIELDRTFSVPNDPRELGLAFGVFEIR